MGKLSHIEDIEERERRKAVEQTPAQEAPQSTPAASEPALEPEQQAQVNTQRAEHPTTEAAVPNARRSLAEQEEDFHGISTVESLGFGHTALIVIAVVIFIAAALYVANYWFHFI